MPLGRPWEPPMWQTGMIFVTLACPFCNFFFNFKLPIRVFLKRLLLNFYQFEKLFYEDGSKLKSEDIIKNNDNLKS